MRKIKNNTSKHGGSRPASGRKKLAPARSQKTFTFSLENRQWQALEEQVERLNQVREKKVTLNSLVTEITGKEANRLYFNKSE